MVCARVACDPAYANRAGCGGCWDSWLSTTVTFCDPGCHGRGQHQGNTRSGGTQDDHDVGAIQPSPASSSAIRCRTYCICFSITLFERRHSPDSWHGLPRRKGRCQGSVTAKRRAYAPALTPAWPRLCSSHPGMSSVTDLTRLQNRGSLHLFHILHLVRFHEKLNSSGGHHHGRRPYHSSSSIGTHGA